MNDEKKISERDAVMRERAAFMRGMRTSLRYARKGCLEQFPDLPGDVLMLEQAAKQVFPLTAIRPRVLVLEDVGGGHREWRASGNHGALSVESRSCGRDAFGKSFAWGNKAQIRPTPSNIAALADLLANPTELAEEV